jgi:hypothetical protein
MYAYITDDANWDNREMYIWRLRMQFETVIEPHRIQRLCLLHIQQYKNTP